MNVTVQQLKKKSNKLACMSEVWNGVTKDYELKQRVGLGSYGEVVAATHISQETICSESFLQRTV